MSEAQSQAAAQYSSIEQMISALSVDYDRLEELRTLAKTPRFVAGYNMPGYMPDSEPAEFDDIDDARSYLANEMRTFADSLQESDCGDDDGQGVWLPNALRNAAAALDVADTCTDYGQTIAGYHYWIAQDGMMLQGEAVEELAELEAAAGEATDEDDAREFIQQDPLSIDVRSDWESAGSELTPSEFRIVLCTGGPAVQIRGELDEHMQPVRAWLEYQDWGTPWAQYFDADQATLLAYCNEFFFGE